ncbi:hypothetical protein PSTT_04202 [Puccinia striiformis]|uniref:Uncharacterized protein n=1 Tax=Puccinia striiformis TaxID=27350 RepID=A0A2S4VSY6_9BASI|nr:hypothetical protein PSTT_04202 [Puccinia striiformis]
MPSQTQSSLAVLSLSYALSPSGSPAVSSSQSVLSQPTGNSICMFTSKAKPSPPPIVFPEPLVKAIDYQWKPEALTKDKVKPRQKRERGERVIQQQKQMKKKVKDDKTPIRAMTARYRSLMTTSPSILNSHHMIPISPRKTLKNQPTTTACNPSAIIITQN